MVRDIYIHNIAYAVVCVGIERVKGYPPGAARRNSMCIVILIIQFQIMGCFQTIKENITTNPWDKIPSGDRIRIVMHRCYIRNIQLGYALYSNREIQRC